MTKNERNTGIPLFGCSPRRSREGGNLAALPLFSLGRFGWGLTLETEPNGTKRNTFKSLPLLRTPESHANGGMATAMSENERYGGI